MFAILIVIMNFIQVYYLSHYSITHHAKVRHENARRKKALVKIVWLTTYIPGLLWLFSPWLSTAQVPNYRSLKITSMILCMYPGQQLPTKNYFWAEFGIAYTFHSMFNSISNPRLGQIDELGFNVV